MTDVPTERLVLSYMGDDHYHRSHDEDNLRPACQPTRIRGVVAIRSEAEKRGQEPCPVCWPSE